MNKSRAESCSRQPRAGKLLSFVSEESGPQTRSDLAAASAGRSQVSVRWSPAAARSTAGRPSPRWTRRRRSLAPRSAACPDPPLPRCRPTLARPLSSAPLSASRAVTPAKTTYPQDRSCRRRRRASSGWRASRPATAPIRRPPAPPG